MDFEYSRRLLVESLYKDKKDFYSENYNTKKKYAFFFRILYFFFVSKIDTREAE